MEIETDGSILPKDALTEAAKILIHHFMLFSDERISLEDEESETESFDEEGLHMRQLLKTKLRYERSCFELFEGTSSYLEICCCSSDLMKFATSVKSLTELEELVDSKNLSFGMDISKYKLDKEYGKKIITSVERLHRKAMLSNWLVLLLSTASLTLCKG